MIDDRAQTHSPPIVNTDEIGQSFKNLHFFITGSQALNVDPVLSGFITKSRAFRDRRYTMPRRRQTPGERCLRIALRSPIHFNARGLEED